MCRGSTTSFLDVNLAVAEGAQRFARSVAQRGVQILFAIHPAHALAAAARRGFEQHRIAQRPGDCSWLAPDPRWAARCREPPALRRRWPRRRAEVFEPILRIASAGGPIKTIPAGGAGFRELGVLAQEAVAGMDRFGSMPPRGFEDLVDAQVALRRRRRPQVRGFIGQAHRQRGAVGVGIDRHAGDAQLPQAANQADGYLSAVGYQYFGEHAGRL